MTIEEELQRVIAEEVCLDTCSRGNWVIVVLCKDKYNPRDLKDFYGDPWDASGTLHNMDAAEEE